METSLYTSNSTCPSECLGTLSLPHPRTPDRQERLAFGHCKRSNLV